MCAWRALLRHHRRLERRRVAHLDIAVAGGQRARRAAAAATPARAGCRQRHAIALSRWSSGISRRARLTLPPPMWVCMSMPPAITTQPLRVDAHAGRRRSRLAPGLSTMRPSRTCRSRTVAVDAVGGVDEAPAAQHEAVGCAAVTLRAPAARVRRRGRRRLRPATRRRERLQRQHDATVAAKQVARRIDARGRHGDEDAGGGAAGASPRRHRRHCRRRNCAAIAGWPSTTAAARRRARPAAAARAEARDPQQPSTAPLGQQAAGAERERSCSKPCACSAVRSGRPGEPGDDWLDRRHCRRPPPSARPAARVVRFRVLTMRRSPRPAAPHAPGKLRRSVDQHRVLRLVQLLRQRLQRRPVRPGRASSRP